MQGAGTLDAAGSSAPQSRTIRECVEVRTHPTVVRLEDLDAGWIVESYHLTGDVRRHLDALRNALGRDRGLGIFLIGPYGSGKSHFLAYAARLLRAGSLREPAPQVVPLSLLHFPAKTPLEEIVAGVLDLPLGRGDRRETWDALAKRHPRGLVLLVDELSELLRSKPDARAFNEDVRFLQFVGERTAQHRLWLLAALQEQIEHAGELEYALYRKIKDRYPLRLLLTPTHVRDLLSECILVKKEGYDAAVAALWRRLCEALPGLPLDGEAMRACYPIHPATLELLEEVRDRFSQTRGAVDFVVTRLAGSAERGVPPFLDRAWGEFVTPEAIVDHFRDLLELQPEFLPISQRVLPHYRRQLPELFESRPQRELAARLIKLLVLLHLVPSREGLDAKEAATWLLVRASRLEPRKNVDIVERILRELADRGRYVARQGERYHLDLQGDGGAALELSIERKRAELAGHGELLFEIVAPLLERAGAVPFSLPRESWESRVVRWHFHERPLAVYLGRETPPPAPEGKTAIVVRLPWGEHAPVPGATTIVPQRLEAGPDLVELAALASLRDQPFSREVLGRLTARLDDRLRLLASRLETAYAGASCTGPGGESETPPRIDPRGGLASWLEGHALWILRRRYPSFERFAPLEGPLPRQAYLQLMRFALAHDLTDEHAPELVQVVREGYLVPMGLLERRDARGYAVPKALDRHELVKLLRPLLDTQPVPRVAYERLADPVYGLVPDQIHLLLVFLLIQGELDIVKGRRSYRELHETLSNPLQYDRLEPGRALSREEIRDLQQLCEGLRVRVPEQWTVLAQRRAARRLAEIARERRAELGGFLTRLEALDGAEKLAAEVRALLGCWGALDKGSDELDGFRIFLEAIGSPSRFLGRVETIAGMPGRVDRLIGEAQRFKHLFGHPALARERSPEVAAHIERLGAPPGPDQPDDLEGWLARADGAYADYKRGYARAHAAWWKEWADAPALRYRPPGVARSRHLELERELAELGELQARAVAQRCRGLVDLDFQPLCPCGFDGDGAPFREAVARLEALRERIEAKARAFFQQEGVREKIAELVDAGVERGAALGRYLDGLAPWPEIRDLDALDRQLAGAAVVHELDLAPILELLCREAWTREGLLAAVAEHLRSCPGERLRFARPDPGAREGLALWCAERALRAGVPLPDGLSAAEHAAIGRGLRAEWIAPAALVRLERLGLSEDALGRILSWLLDGTISPPESSQASPLVAAALEVLRPTRPHLAEDLARLAADLYCHQERLARVGGRQFLARLDAMARVVLSPEPPPLVELLRRHEDAAWLVVDALGAPLALGLLDVLDESLGRWRRESVDYALSPQESTTAAWQRELVAAHEARPIEKIDALDALLHERFVPLDELSRLAGAELRIALRRVASRFDPARPLLILADHGFRVSVDGRAYIHGGPSTLERLVPVIRYCPA